MISVDPKLSSQLLKPDVSLVFGPDISSKCSTAYTIGELGRNEMKHKKETDSGDVLDCNVSAEISHLGNRTLDPCADCANENRN